MSGRVSDRHRDAFRALVDVLLPAAHGMPAGNAVGVADAGLDKVLDLRADLIPDLLQGLNLVLQQGVETAMTMLPAENEAWRAVRLAAFGAYYNAPPIQAILNYAGASARPYDVNEVQPYTTDGSLARVIARGPIWRKVDARA